MSSILLKSDSCDNLVNLRGNDLLELLATIESLMLKYRKSINIPESITFGVEIEYEQVVRKLVNRYIRNNLPEWNSKSDSTVSSGGEVTSPIMTDTREYWEELKKICGFLKRNSAVTNRHAGGHIHVGSQVLGNDVDAWRIFVKLYMLYEDVMIRFFYGDKLNRRATFNQYSPPVANYIFEDLERINEATNAEKIIGRMCRGKYGAINFGHIYNYDEGDSLNRFSDGSTIELRCPNGTDEEVIWQNNINTFTKMLDSSKKQAIDEEFLDYKIKSYDDRKESFYYDEVQLKKALEFVDLIFDNNLDKAYFLRQYFKGFQNSPEASEALYAKSFIK